MPTYTVTTSNINLNSKKQKELAQGITKVHNVVTGANTYFAQVIFNNTKKKNHFMGGKIVKEPSIFLLGQIRAGRPKKTKDKLISDLKNIIVEKSKLDGKFDLILMFEVLEHLDDWKKTIKKIKKNLNKNGIIIISTINRNSFSKLFAISIAENILK